MAKTVTTHPPIRRVKNLLNLLIDTKYWRLLFGYALAIVFWKAMSDEVAAAFQIAYEGGCKDGKEESDTTDQQLT